MIRKNKYCQFGENLQKITEATGDDLNHSNSIINNKGLMKIDTARKVII
jgi:hypothetical protein